MRYQSLSRITVIIATLLSVGCGGAQTPSGDSQSGSTNVDSATDSTGIAFRAQLDLPWPDLSAAPSVAVGGGDKDAAVIVGIERYTYVPKVLGAVKNAKDWHIYFTKTLGIPEGRVKLLPQDLAVKEEILNALQAAASSAEPGGRVWFVFIGHGAPTQGDGLLVGVDAQQTVTSLESRSLKRGDALAVLKQSAARPVVILDACFSGHAGKDEEVVSGLQPLVLADMPEVGEAVVLTAAASDQYAGPLPGSRTARPAFSYLTLGALRGWGDVNSDGQVSADEVAAYTQKAMGALVFGRKQEPSLEGADKAAVLAMSAREAGPDIGALSRQLSEGEVVFNGDGLVLGDLPTLNLQELNREDLKGEINIGDIDIEREKEMEKKFLNLQEAKRQVEVARASSKNDVTGEKQEKAWCKLAALEEPNPYRNQAETACSQATAYVEQRRRLIVAMNRDWEIVKVFMNLKHRSIEDKKKVMAAFVRAYTLLTEQAVMREATRGYQALNSGKTPAQAEAENPAGAEWVYSKPAKLEFTKTEITLGQFKQCVSAGACDEKNRKTKSDFEKCNWGWSDRDNHPMNCADWVGADAFCKWAGGRLPTEEEWYAEASNGSEKREWPWGNSPDVSCDYAIWGDGNNTDGCEEDSTWPVCSKTKGNSVSGLCDMSGNVWEWTSTDYDSSNKVLRGGSWYFDFEDYLRASGRYWGTPTDGYYIIGFRCVRSSR